MSNGFDEVVEAAGLDPAERRRLEHAHELLVSAGPPAELPAGLERPPVPPRPALRELPREPRVRFRRAGLAAATAVAAAVAAACFAFGYALGDGSGDSFDVERVVAMAGERGETATLSVGAADDAGNRTLEFSVEGLTPHTSERGYYELFLERDGEPGLPCGGFRLPEGDTASTFRFTVPYSVEDDDRWVLTTIEPGEIRWPGEIVMRHAKA
jgi:hypothetical protein